MRRALLWGGIFAALFISAFGGGFLIGSQTPKNGQNGAVKADTLIIYRVDTITAVKPAEIGRYVHDTIYLPVTDTITIERAQYLPLPMESKQYRGADYYAVVTGYAATLDTISVYPREKVTTITRTIQAAPPKLNIYAGVFATGGAGVSCAPVVGATFRVSDRGRVTGLGGYDVATRAPFVAVGGTFSLWCK